MNKLVDFLSSKKAAKAEKARKAREIDSPRRITFSSSEKEEIKQTVRTLNRETSMILTKKLKEANLIDLVKEMELPDDSEDDNYGTFRPTKLSSSYDTFRPANSSNDDGDQYGTFRPQNSKDDEEDQYGTFRPGSSASGDSSTPPFVKSRRSQTDGVVRSSTDPTGNLAKATGVAPDLCNLFREPENWEKHILALEKGEWTEGMEQNGAFKRWKKERPSMPSIYLRESEGS